MRWECRGGICLSNLTDQQSSPYSESCCFLCFGATEPSKISLLILAGPCAHKSPHSHCSVVSFVKAHLTALFVSAASGSALSRFMMKWSQMKTDSCENAVLFSWDLWSKIASPPLRTGLSAPDSLPDCHCTDQIDWFRFTSWLHFLSWIAASASARRGTSRPQVVSNTPLSCIFWAGSSGFFGLVSAIYERTHWSSWVGHAGIQVIISVAAAIFEKSRFDSSTSDSSSCASLYKSRSNCNLSFLFKCLCWLLAKAIRTAFCNWWRLLFAGPRTDSARPL